MTNFHNSHTWALENPHAIRETRYQHRFSVNVWAGIIDDHLIGPHIIPNRFTAAHYLEFLEDTLPELLDDVPLALRRNMWYQHDGAPIHTAGPISAWLANHYPQRWIGRRGPVPWPARSPDLTPLDFYLWGCLKEQVYCVPIDSIEQLINRLQQAAAEIRQRPEQLRNVQHSSVRRCEACVERNGYHFEQVL